MQQCCPLVSLSLSSSVAEGMLAAQPIFQPCAAYWGNRPAAFLLPLLHEKIMPGPLTVYVRCPGSAPSTKGHWVLSDAVFQAGRSVRVLKKSRLSDRPGRGHPPREI